MSSYSESLNFCVRHCGRFMTFKMMQCCRTDVPEGPSVLYFRKLRIVDCSLRVLGRAALKGLKFLTELDLSRNALTELPSALSSLPVQRLVLERNQFTTVNKKLLEVGCTFARSLVHLDLSENQVSVQINGRSTEF